MPKRTAAAFNFPLSIPRRWAVAELLRVSREVQDEVAQFPPTGRAHAKVLALLEGNPEVSARDVYGLTAVALHKEGALKGVESVVSSLFEKTIAHVRDHYRNAPTSPKPKLIDGGHRWFRAGSDEIDPLYVFLKNKNVDTWKQETKRAYAYPESVVLGVLAQFENSAHSADDPTQMWFRNVVRRLARRQQLTPHVWSSESPKDIRARTGFEGYMRILLPRLREESASSWEYYLTRALTSEFPSWDSESIVRFVQRIQQEFGPEAPRSMYKQRKRIKLVDPLADFLLSEGYGYGTGTGTTMNKRTSI